MRMSDDIDLTKHESFKNFYPVTIRFSDQDSMGHVNNVSFAQYVEVGRTMLIQSVIEKFGHEGLDFILANVSINYLKEVHYPGTIDVGARITRIGSKSLTSGYGLFQGDDCVATSTSVNVFYDMRTRKSTPPPDDVRREVERMIAEAE